MSRRLAGITFCLLTCAALGSAQSHVRTVQGTVVDGAGNALPGAVVQIENTRNLQIRSYITQERGTYYFNDLSPDVEYKLHATYRRASSAPQTLTAFDSREHAVIDIKIRSVK